MHVTLGLAISGQCNIPTYQTEVMLWYGNFSHMGSDAKPAAYVKPDYSCLPYYGNRYQ